MNEENIMRREPYFGPRQEMPVVEPTSPVSAVPAGVMALDNQPLNLSGPMKLIGILAFVGLAVYGMASCGDQILTDHCIDYTLHSPFGYASRDDAEKMCQRPDYRSRANYLYDQEIADAKYNQEHGLRKRSLWDR